LYCRFTNRILDISTFDLSIVTVKGSMETIAWKSN